MIRTGTEVLWCPSHSFRPRRECAGSILNFPPSHGIPRVDDRHVTSRIAYVIRHGSQWRGAPTGCDPHKTRCNRFVRLSRFGVLDRIVMALVAEAAPPERLMIDGTHSGRPLRSDAAVGA